jgi:hypothetical protein
MQNAVAVALIFGAGGAWRLGLQPPAARPLIDGVGRKGPCVRRQAVSSRRRVNDPFGFAATVD